MRTLYIDAFSGISGNMMLGACLELGVPREHIEQAFAALGLPELHLRVAARDAGNHLVATHVTVMAGDVPADPEDAHVHDHGHAHHRVHDHAHDRDHAHEHGHGDVGVHDHGHGHVHEHGGVHRHAHDPAHGRADSSAVAQPTPLRDRHAPSGAHSHVPHDPHGHAHAHEASGPHSHVPDQHPTHDHDHHDHDHHDHDHHHDHAHRSYASIRALIAGSGLTDAVKRLALGMFRRIAEAEARMHGTSVEAVHFHEVGALDSIGDVVGAAAAVDWLGVERVVCSPLPMGRGFVRSAHGRIPLPAPATAHILIGASLVGVEREFEFVTPTGAAIVMELASGFGPMPALVLERVGHGAGSRRLPGHSNLLRLFLGRASEAAQHAGGVETRELVELAAAIDDMNPEHFGALRERLAALDGVLDVAWAPLTMKDGRPGVGLEVLCTPQAAPAARHLVLTESTSLGVRTRSVRRDALERRFVEVATAWGAIPIKLGVLDGRVVNLAPEYRVARERSLAHGVPLKQVYADAVAAARELGVSLGAPAQR